MHTGSW